MPRGCLTGGVSGRGCLPGSSGIPVDRQTPVKT